MNSKYFLNFAAMVVYKPLRWPQWLVVVLCMLWSLIAFAADTGEYLHDAQAYFNKGEIDAP